EGETIVQRPLHVAAGAVLAEIVVGIEAVVGAVLVGAGGGERFIRDRRIQHRVTKSVTAGFDVAVNSAGSRSSQHVDDSGHRFRSVQRGEWSAHYLDLFDAGGREASPVVAGKVRIVQNDPVP